MPELPDVVVYIEALQRRTVWQVLEKVRLFNPFVLRSVDPPVEQAQGKRVVGLRRLGKRIAFELEDDLYLVIHLMIAGRLHWKEKGGKPPGKIGLAAFDFATGTLIFTEAGTQRRASLNVVRGESELEAHRPGGI